MAAPTSAASAPIAPATGAFWKAAPVVEAVARLVEAVLLVGVPVPLELDLDPVVEGPEVLPPVVVGAEVEPVPVPEVVSEIALLETMGGVTVSIQE